MKNTTVLTINLIDYYSWQYISYVMWIPTSYIIQSIHSKFLLIIYTVSFFKLNIEILSTLTKRLGF